MNVQKTQLKFISISLKFFVLVFFSLVILSITITVLSYSEISNKYQEYKIQKSTRGQQEFFNQSQIAHEQIRIWLESIFDLTESNNINNFDTLSGALSQQFEMLQMNYNVEALWLVSNNFQPIYQSKPISENAKSSIKQSIATSSPTHVINCNRRCVQNISIPILKVGHEIAVVSLEMSFTHIIKEVSMILDADVAIVSLDKNLSFDQYIGKTKLINSSAPILMDSLFTQGKITSFGEKKHSEGIELSYDNKRYWVSFLSLVKADEQNFYLVQIHDVAQFTDLYQQYREQFILYTSLLLLIISFFVIFMIVVFTRRILTLTNAMSLLSTQQFHQFRQQIIPEHKRFPDEVSIFADRIYELSIELEEIESATNEKVAKLQQKVMHDFVTGLPNEKLLTYLINKLLKINQVDFYIGVMLVDIDILKVVNDKAILRENKELLVRIANRLQLVIAEEDIVCYIDESRFVVLVYANCTQTYLESLAKNILLKLSKPFELESHSYQLVCSIGISNTADKSITPSDVIHCADLALNEAKIHGGGKYAIYQGKMVDEIKDLIDAEKNLMKIAEQGQFSLSFQPQILLASKKIRGYEVLLRWRHPDRGMISPEDFIPAIGSHNQIIEFGYWMLHRCFNLVASLTGKNFDNAFIAINLSAEQFQDDNLEHYFQQLSKQFSLPLSRFELELTESILLNDIEFSIFKMQSLKRLGFKLVVDDFGQEYSSYAYLQQLPLDIVKIDKRFVLSMFDDQNNFKKLASTIAMVKKLGLTVIANGVETSTQKRSLLESSCDAVQGFYISKPIPENKLLEFIDQQINDDFWNE